MIFNSSRRLYRPTPLHIGSTGRFSNIVDMIRMSAGAGFTSATWPANNRAYYVPLHIPARFTVARFFTCNGTAVSGNLDIGLYDGNGNRLMSTGSTAQAGTNAVQYIGATDQSFPPGHYYLALVLSATAGRLFRCGMSDQYNVRQCGVLEEDLGSTVLPTTMTPVSCTQGDVYCFGFSQSDTL